MNDLKAIELVASYNAEEMDVKCYPPQGEPFLVSAKSFKKTFPQHIEELQELIKKVITDNTDNLLIVEGQDETMQNDK